MNIKTSLIFNLREQLIFRLVLKKRDHNYNISDVGNKFWHISKIVLLLECNYSRLFLLVLFLEALGKYFPFSPPKSKGILMTFAFCQGYLE